MSNVVGRPEALERMDEAQLVLHGFGNLLMIAFGEDRLGGEAVHPHAIGPRLDGQLLAEHFDAGLGGGD